MLLSQGRQIAHGRTRLIIRQRPRERGDLGVRCEVLFQRIGPRVRGERLDGAAVPADLVFHGVTVLSQIIVSMPVVNASLYLSQP